MGFITLDFNLESREAKVVKVSHQVSVWQKLASSPVNSLNVVVTLEEHQYVPQELNGIIGA